MNLTVNYSISSCTDRQPLLKTLIHLQILSYKCRNLNYPKTIMLAFDYIHNLTKLTFKNIICVKCINGEFILFTKMKQCV